MKKPSFLKEYFCGFLICNLVFFILQIAYIFFSESSFIHAISYPARVYIELSGAFFLEIILYIILAGVQTLLLWGVSHYIQRKPAMDRWQLIIFFLSTLSLITINCYFFPLSRFSRIFLPALPVFFISIIMIVSLMGLFLLLLVTLWQLIRNFPLWTTISTIILLGFFILPKQSALMKFTNTQPNLLIIGVDSLSPETISQELTPNIYNFLEDSVHFTETISPLARTYPAWATILTGLYPINHLARENLYPGKMVKSKNSFAWNLQKLGYYTIFASDDRRFNNLDKDFGFDEIIGPHIGVNDVLLGSFFDFPLSNLLINLRISKWLLPFNYINRAGHFSYYPSTFDNELQYSLAKGIKKNQPTFIAIHFTLPHWPYAWAVTPPEKVVDEYNVYDREEIYRAAVIQADQQVGKLLSLFKKTDAYNNSVVILLSDHGEVLYKTGSRKTDPALYQGANPSKFEKYLSTKLQVDLQKSVGHGTDLLSPSQFHCVLGFKIFRQGQLTSRPLVVERRVALIDIAPTIASLFNFTLKEQPDGISLANTILHQTLPLDHRSFLLESGLLPNQFLSKEKVIEYAKSIFTVDSSNDRVEIRQDQFAAINAMKLYGILKDHWLVALYPDNQNYITVVLNLNNGLWTDDPHSDFAQQSQLPDMLNELRHFYLEDLANYPQVLTIKKSN